MRTPSFWAEDTRASRLLSPLGAITNALTARRLARPGWRAPIPVLCAGNATAGGSGKTPLCLDLAARLSAAGHTPHILSRGHGGASHRRPLLVTPGIHDASEAGDEPLLLAEAAPCWACPDRRASAEAAIAEGASILLMDDGLQNSALIKDIAFLVVDGGYGFGNGRSLPAGPLREPAANALARCQAVVLIGADATGALDRLRPAIPVLRARLEPAPEMRARAGQEVAAFAGIGRPEKFFATLRTAGLHVSRALPFPDHHRYTRRDLARLRLTGLPLVTTWKDYVRLTPDDRHGITPLGAVLAWQDEDALGRVLAPILPAPDAHGLLAQ